MRHRERLDEDLLEKYADHFFGYGSFSGKYWFIGMEEGGGNNFKELADRLRVWHERGMLELEDVAEFSAAIGLNQWVGPKTRLQRT